MQGTDTQGMLEYARYAEALAPDGIIAIPPTAATTLGEFRDYYAALCEVTGRPIFFQTSGGAPDVVPTVDFMVGMAREFPNLAYVKEERDPVHERMLALKEHRPDPVKSIFGAAFGRQWLYEMRLGMDGVMTGGAMYADVYARLWELHEAGRQDELRDLFGRLLLMLNLDRTIPGIRLYVLQKRGIFKTTKSRRGEYSFTTGPGSRDRVPPRRHPPVLPGVGRPPADPGCRDRAPTEPGKSRAASGQHAGEPVADVAHLLGADLVRHRVLVVLDRAARLDEAVAAAAAEVGRHHRIRGAVGPGRRARSDWRPTPSAASVSGSGR